MVISIFFAVISYEEVYDLSKVDEQTAVDNERVFNEDAFKKWKHEYEHPLVVGSSSK